MEKLEKKATPEEIQKSRELFDTLAWMRAFLCMMVVTIHAHYFDASQTYSKSAHEFVILLSRIAVPAFFFISGLLFFRGNDFSLPIYIDKLKRRSQSLLIPYILFNYLTVAVFAILVFILKIKFNAPTIFETGDWWLCLSLIKPSPIMLWFVHDLIILAIISPIIYWLIKKIGISFLIIAGTYLICHPLSTSFSGGVGLFWFSAGAFSAINKIDLIETTKKLNKWLLLLAWITSTCILHFCHFKIPGGIVACIALGVITCFSWAIYFQKRFNVPAWVNYLAGASMFIYLVHGFIPNLAFIKIFKQIYANILPHNSISAGTLIFAHFICMYFSSLAIYAILKRFFPKLCRLLSGGR